MLVQTKMNFWVKKSAFVVESNMFGCWYWTYEKRLTPPTFLSERKSFCNSNFLLLLKTRECLFMLGTHHLECCFYEKPWNVETQNLKLGTIALHFFQLIFFPNHAKCVTEIGDWTVMVHPWAPSGKYSRAGFLLPGRARRAGLEPLSAAT